MQIKITDNATMIKARLSGYAKELPFITARALTMIGQKVKQKEIMEIERVIDRPTSRTKRAIYLRPAKKRTMTATVGIVDKGQGTPAAQYLMPLIKGVARGHKRFESALKHRGILRSNEYVAPSKYNSRLNRFGNLTSKTYQSIITSIDSGAGKYVYVERGSARGIWVKSGKLIKPFLVFVSRPKYKRLFDFYAVGEREVKLRYGPAFSESFRMVKISRVLRRGETRG